METDAKGGEERRQGKAAEGGRRGGRARRQRGTTEESGAQISRAREQSKELRASVRQAHEGERSTGTDVLTGSRRQRAPVGSIPLLP